MIVVWPRQADGDDDDGDIAMGNLGAIISSVDVLFLKSLLLDVRANYGESLLGLGVWPPEKRRGLMLPVLVFCRCVLLIYVVYPS